MYFKEKNHPNITQLQKYIWFLLQKEDLTRAEAQIISQNDNEENKENNPSETAVLSATVNRLNIDLQECRQIITNKDSEISRLQVQYSESVRQLDTLVSF